MMVESDCHRAWLWAEVWNHLPRVPSKNHTSVRRRIAAVWIDWRPVPTSKREPILTDARGCIFLMLLNWLWEIWWFAVLFYILFLCFYANSSQSDYIVLTLYFFFTLCTSDHQNSTTIPWHVLLNNIIVNCLPGESNEFFFAVLSLLVWPSWLRGSHQLS